MTAFAMTEPALACPTSGPMLRAFIHAFQLGRSGPDGRSLIGSADEERNDRRYLQGDTVPDDVRERVAAGVASALIEAGYVKDLRVPDPPGPLPAQEVLTLAVIGWLATWDAVYYQCSTGWPYPPKALGTFVLGREAAIDLALRVAAAIHLGGRTPSSRALHAARENGGAAILESAMRAAGCKMGYAELAKAADVDTRTAQRWLNESLAPDDINLRRLAHVLAGSDAPAERGILTGLRIQYGVLRLAQHLESVCGPRWAQQLIEGFEWLLHCAVETNERIRADPSAFDSNVKGLEFAQFDLLLNGSTSQIAPPHMSLWLETPRPAIWGYELGLASTMPLEARLERCFQIIGDWPRFWKQLLPHTAEMGMVSAGQMQAALETTKLAMLCPPLRELIESQPPKHADIGMPRALEQLIQRAISCQIEHRFEEAIKLWQDVLQQSADDVECLVYYGVALRSAGRCSDAFDTLRRAVELDPASNRAHLEIAYTYAAQGLADMALHYLEGLPEAVKSCSAEVLYFIGTLLYREDRFPQALEALEQSLALDDDNADGHDLAARALLRMPQSRENRERAAGHAKRAATCERRRGRSEWQNTKRHKRS